MPSGPLSLYDLRLPTEPVGFSMTFDAGRIRLLTGSVPLFSFVTIDRLLMTLSPPAGPLDLSGGARRFRHDPAEIQELRLTIHRQSLRDVLFRASGGQIIDIAYDQDRIGVLMRVNSGEGNEPITLSLSIAVEAIGSGRLRLTADRMTSYNWSELPILALVQQVTRELGISSSLLRQLAWNRWELELLDPLLQVLLAPDDWNLPRTDGVRIAVSQLATGAFQLLFTTEPAAITPSSEDAAEPTEDSEFDQSLHRMLALGDFEEALVLLDPRRGRSAEQEQIYRQLLLASARGLDRLTRLTHHRLAEESENLRPLLTLVAAARFFHQDNTAMSYLNRVAELAESDGDRINRIAALTTLGDLHRAQNPRTAAEYYLQALRLDPLSPWALPQLARLYQEIYDIEALRQLAQLVSELPAKDLAQPTALFALNAICAVSNDRIPRAPIFQDALESASHPVTRGTLSHALAELLLQNGSTDDALDLLEEAMELTPPNPDAFWLLGQLYLQNGFEDDYFDLARDWIANHVGAGCNPVRNDLAEFLAREGRPEEAQAQYRAILQDDPEHLAALEGLRGLFQTAGNTPALLQTLARLDELAHRNPRAREVSAEYIDNLLRCGRYSDASSCLQRWQEQYGETAEWIAWTSRLANRDNPVAVLSGTAHTASYSGDSSD